MLNLNEQSGEITIEFPDLGPVTIKPPKFGAYRRIRAERQRIAEKSQEQIAALPKLDPLPDANDQSEEAVAERARLTPFYQRRLLEVQELLAVTLAEIWKLILLGDESFKGLANPAPPEDSDEWPSDMLIDGTMLDIVVGHMGKVRRSASGPTAPAP